MNALVNRLILASIIVVGIIGTGTGISMAVVDKGFVITSSAYSKDDATSFDKAAQDCLASGGSFHPVRTDTSLSGTCSHQ